MLIKRGNDSYGLMLSALRSGAVAIAACDTIYGLIGKVPDSEDGIRRIKGREETKPFLQLIPDTEALAHLGIVMPDSDILDLWPGPFTFVLTRMNGDTVAYRVPEDARLRDLIRGVGAPLFSTSVNRAGEAPMNDPMKIHEEFGEEVVLVEDSGIYEGRIPSTVVDLTSRPYRILRQGAGEVPSRYL